jgi:hypothetical protein
MASLPHGARPRLPRIWTPKGTPFAVGAMVPGGLHESLAAVSALEENMRAAGFTRIPDGRFLCLVWREDGNSAPLGRIDFYISNDTELRNGFQFRGTATFPGFGSGETDFAPLALIITRIGVYAQMHCCTATCRTCNLCSRSCYLTKL